MLAAALGFQAIGYAPCELCIPATLAASGRVLVGALIWWLGWSRLLELLGAVAALTATGLAIYHAGVEPKLWLGPALLGGCRDCADVGAGPADGAADRARRALQRSRLEPVRRISMAGWNAIISAGLSGLWLASLRGRNQSPAPAETRIFSAFFRVVSGPVSGGSDCTRGWYGIDPAQQDVRGDHWPTPPKTTMISMENGAGNGTTERRDGPCRAGDRHFRKRCAHPIWIMRCRSSSAARSPTLRDGLKPVHWRILFAMHETGNTFDKPYRKSARPVGDVMVQVSPPWRRGDL